MNNSKEEKNKAYESFPLVLVFCLFFMYIISSKFFLSFKTHKTSDGGGGAEFGTKFLETSVYTWGPNLLHDSKIPPLLTSTKFFPLGLKPVPHDPDNT